jgi:hypothetical protein
MPEPVHIELTADEALVLSEFLARYCDSNTLTIEDQAEQRALWNLHCLLEKQLVEPFDPNYSGLVDAARDRLRDPVE